MDRAKDSGSFSGGSTPPRYIISSIIGVYTIFNTIKK